MTVSELMKALADAGAPMEAIIIAVEALEAKDAEIAAREAAQEEKRAKDAERKRIERASRRAQGQSTDGPRTVHGRGADGPRTIHGRGADAPLSLPPNDINSNPPTHTPGIKPARVNGPAKPDDVSEAVWRDFVAHRKTKKAPVSETALAGIRREAAKVNWPLEDALAETVAQGWQGFKADWVTSKDQAPDNGFLGHVLKQQATQTRQVDELFDADASSPGGY